MTENSRLRVVCAVVYHYLHMDKEESCARVLFVIFVVLPRDGYNWIFAMLGGATELLQNHKTNYIVSLKRMIKA